MVTWQLQHNREQYELRVKRLRNFIQREASVGGLEGNEVRSGSKNIPENISGNSGSVHDGNHFRVGPDHNSGTWIDKIFQLVAIEKIKLLKQTETAKNKLLAEEEELDMLKALNQSLKNNQIEWHKRLDSAKGNVLVYENTVKKAANKVKILMKKLDTVATPSSSSHHPNTENVNEDGDGDGDGDEIPKERGSENEKADLGSRDSRIIAPSSSTNIFHQKRFR